MNSFSQYLFTEMPMETGNDVGLIVSEPESPTFFALIKNSYRLQSAIRQTNYEELESHVYGAISTRDNTKYGCIEVDKVWARPGYGPLLYYIIMSEAGQRGVMANRVSGQVSDEAKSVWRNFYSGVGRGLVKAVPLDAEGYNHHSEDYLMKKYVILKPLNLKEFLRKGKSIIGRDPHGEKMNLLIEVADGMLDQQMDKIYRDD